MSGRTELQYAEATRPPTLTDPHTNTHTLKRRTFQNTFQMCVFGK